MAQRPPPLMTSANGLHRLSISEINPDRNQPGQSDYAPLPENSWAFTDLASAINIGLEILETPPGKAVLIRLGTRLVEEWRVQNAPCFRAGTGQMAHYVDYFLSAIRSDFPITSIKTLGSPDILASSRREVNQWNGDLLDFKPKGAFILEYNHCRVNDMIRASRAVDELERNRGTPEGRSMRNKMLLRHKHFQFMFATATAHEICHAFLGYISQNGRHGDLATPPTISHLDYGGYQPTSDDEDDDDVNRRGEAGRWVENRLFGGSLEFYRDRNDDDGQPGILHVLDSNEVAWKIDPKAILKFVEGSRRFEFPLERTGQGINRQQRARLGLRSLGSTQAAPYLPEVLFMRARLERRLPLYNISREELNSVRERPRILRAVRVA